VKAKLAIRAVTLFILCIGLNACVNDEAKFDYSQCDETIDFHYWEHPWGNRDTVNGLYSSISVFHDTLPNGRILLTDNVFSCNPKRDTCWYFKPMEQQYHADTVNFGNECGLESTCGPIIACKLDDTHSMLVDTWTLDEYYGVAVNPALMLDTNSNPATRSAYKIWWPLPRTPWPKGESVAADSLVWAD